MDEVKDAIGWAIVELMGHRRLGAYVSEQVVAGAAFLRLDVPQDPPAEPYATQLYSAGAVYCVTPTTEAMARAVSGVVEPVHRWELPAPEPEPDDAEVADDGRRSRYGLAGGSADAEVAEVDADGIPY